MVIGDHRTDDGGGWVTLADPEGDGFCIVRSAAERPSRTSPPSYRIGS